MTGADFHKWVADPALLDRNSLQSLKELTARYPYFVSAQLLLAKNLKLENHIDQRRQLHVAAIHVSDRKLLFALMEGVHPSNKLKDAAQHAIEVAESIEPVEHDAIEKAQQAPISEPASVVERAEVVQEIQSDNIEPVADEAVSSSMDKEEEHSEAGTEGDAQLQVSRQSLYDLIPEPLIYRIEDAVLPELPVVEHEAEPTELAFDQWLARLATVQGAKEEIAEHRPAAQLPRSGQHKDNLALIADFLASQPNNNRGQRAEFFKPSKASERSNQQEFKVISETLASIYEQQGKYELAIKAFDALAVKYPEKSSYFAARKTAAQEKQSGLSG